ncbi:MAG: hypothetical protein JNL12_07125 [Planctomycetes bacterium]|nr:hypothetical protein [Planctomycetota bacterium]
MRGRSRLLLALLFVALFASVPDPDATTGRPYLVFLRVREWLLAADGPLAPWVQDGALPPLVVALRQSPPPTDAADLARRQDEYARTAAEWCAARRAEGRTIRLDAARGHLPLSVRAGDAGFLAELPHPDGSVQRLQLPYASRASLLPALVAILLAVLTQRVLLALALAGLCGGIAFVASALPGAGGSPSLLSTAWSGAEHFVGSALWQRSLCHDFYLRITLFVVFLFLTVGLIGRNGGVHGLVRALRRHVRGPVSAQLVAWLSGLLVFFDDYTNCLLVGTTMRPLCDDRGVSRAKLAYIVDSTAAPVAGLSVFSTWVVYEMSMYQAPLSLVTRADGSPYVPGDAFEVFLASLPFRCYCWFTLLLVPMVALLRRDLGPMRVAEQRARERAAVAGPGPDPERAHEPAVAPAAAERPARARNALLPMLVLVLGTLVGMVLFGLDEGRALPAGTDFATRVRTVLANAESDVALLVASASAFATALGLTLGQRLLNGREIVAVSLAAVRPLVGAFGILFLAWSLGHVCRDLGTSFYLTAAARASMHALALPLVLFVVAGAMAFATGTSFGTMAILLPNVVVLAHQLGTEAAFTGSPAAGGPALMLLCIGAVLEGAIFGDHCSPISDTTVLSSLGAGCDLLEHVGTQLPYALLAMATSAFCGYLPLALLGPTYWPWCYGIGLVVMAVVLRFAGGRTDQPPPMPHG